MNRSRFMGMICAALALPGCLSASASDPDVGRRLWPDQSFVMYLCQQPSFEPYTDRCPAMSGQRGFVVEQVLQDHQFKWYLARFDDGQRAYIPLTAGIAFRASPPPSEAEGAKLAEASRRWEAKLRADVKAIQTRIATCAVRPELLVGLSLTALQRRCGQWRTAARSASAGVVVDTLIYVIDGQPALLVRAENGVVTTASGTPVQ